MSVTVGKHTIMVLGSPSSGRTSLIASLCGLDPTDMRDIALASPGAFTCTRLYEFDSRDRRRPMRHSVQFLEVPVSCQNSRSVFQLQTVVPDAFFVLVDTTRSESLVDAEAWIRWCELQAFQRRDERPSWLHGRPGYVIVGTKSECGTSVSAKQLQALATKWGALTVVEVGGLNGRAGGLDTLMPVHGVIAGLAMGETHAIRSKYHASLAQNQAANHHARSGIQLKLEQHMERVEERVERLQQL